MPRGRLDPNNGRTSCIDQSPLRPPEVVHGGGQFNLVVVQMEVDGQGDPTGTCCKLRPAGTTRPVGDWPKHWGGCIHEFDGHGIDAIGSDRDGEKRLTGKLDALYVHHGVEHASDDVSGAWLDPAFCSTRP